MAHPNQQTNGASLEDCHTNFFALVNSLVVMYILSGRSHGETVRENFGSAFLT